MEEIWKDIKDYEGRYAVSNLGRIKSYPKKGHGHNSIILKSKLTKDGYYETALLSKGKGKNQYKYIRTHRIVAQAFIPNPENKPEINHKDGNKLNNNVDNLEWVTSSENQLHAYRTGLQKVSGYAILGRKPIYCIELNVTMPSLNHMQRYLYEKGYTPSKKLNRLSNVMNSDKHVYLGMHFRFVNGGER